MNLIVKWQGFHKFITNKKEAAALMVILANNYYFFLEIMIKLN